MFASQGEVVLERPELLALIAVPVVAFYAINLALGFGIGRLLAFSCGEMVCFNDTVLSRNSPTALAIAVVAFPNERLIPLALVIGPSLELSPLGPLRRFTRRSEIERGGRSTRPPRSTKVEIPGVSE